MRLTRTRIIPGLLLLVLSQTATRAADDTAPEARFISNSRQLILDGRRSGEGYFSPDGKQLIFQSEREPGNPFYQVYTLDLETGDTTRVSPGKGKTTCSFFQPGTDRVIFASTHADLEAEAKQKAELDFRASGKERRYSWDYDENFDIWSARRDGSDLKNSHPHVRLRCRGRLLAGRQTDRLLLAPRRFSARQTSA